MYENRKIAVFCNTLSGNGKGVKLAEYTSKKLQTIGVQHQVFINDWTTDLSTFSEIWLAGGDGTIHHYINTYDPQKHIVALIGGGTGNDLKTFLYGIKPLNSHIQSLLDHYEDIDIDLGNCNGILYCNSLGIGFDGDVLQNIKTIRKIGGHFGYLLAVIKSIFTFREKTFKLELSGNIIEINPVILAISNSRLTGGGFVIAPKASLTDGHLDLMYTVPLPRWKRLWVLPKVEKGKHLNLPYVSHHHVPSVKITSKTEVLYQIDGELESAKTFDIKIHDKKLKLRLIKPSS